MSTATSPRSDLETQAKRAEVVKLRLAGKTNVDIAALVGITESGVRYHTKSWLESIAPPEERAHEMRETWLGRLETAHEKVWPQVQEGDAKAIEVMLKIQQQASRLYGLDMSPNIQIGLFSAEGLAAALGYDDQVIDVEAVEQPALEPGDDA